MATRAESFFWRAVMRTLPRSRRGDYLVSLLWFVRTQRRWPQPDRLWFNDQLFRIRASAEILDPLRVLTSDKELVKLYVKATVGDEHNVPTLAVLRSAADCRSYAFPRRCVVKPTHMSGTVILRRGGEAVDLRALDKWLDSNAYDASREANYRTLRPKIIVEPFVFDDDNPRDYKVFCVHGRPAIIQVDSDRFLRHTRNFYDCEWRRLPFHMTHPPGLKDDPRPANLSHMLQIASRLSHRFPFVRVDLYSDDRQVLVGELTHCHGGAREFFVPRSAEAAFSRLLFKE